MFPYNLSASIRGVLFDFDGTLTVPHGLDFVEIRRRMGCPEGESILEYLESLRDPKQRRTAQGILEEAEAEAAGSAVLQAGVAEFVTLLRARGVKVGIITRNSRLSVDSSFASFGGALASDDFDIIVTRDSGVRFKPDPEGVLFAAGKFGIPASRVALVGDYRYDMEAAQAAGAFAVYLRPDGRASPPCDMAVGSYAELREKLEPVLQLADGKIPNRLLARCLSDIDAGNPALLVGPGVGEDVAVIEPDGSKLITLKSDPITFPAEGAARQAIMVNANDIATSGGEPRFFQCTLLFPSGTAPCEVVDAFRDLGEALSEAGITLCGGHSEVTDAVRRLVVSGTMIGTVEPGMLVSKTGMQEGDRIIMTKAAGIEGTSILAAEFAKELVEGGMLDAELGEARAYQREISIVAEARIAAGDGGATAMHDVTEGGVVTALSELAVAGRHTLRVDLDRIPVRELTRRIGGVLGVDPLGLIGSGALLFTCPAGSAARITEKLSHAGIDAAEIGSVGAASAQDELPSIEAFRGGRRADFPVFEVDELARRLSAKVGRAATASSR